MNFITFQIILVAILISLALSVPARKLSQRLRFLDIPGSEPHKSHGRPVPLAGGAVILLSTAVTGLIFDMFSAFTVRTIFLSSMITFLFGLWDDIRELSLGWKFAGQLLAATFLIWQGIGIRLFPQHPWLGVGLTYLWMVGITNAFNFVDSMDGLANGLAVLAAAFFALGTAFSRQGDLFVLSATLVGAFAGTLFSTMPAAKLFLGDSGAQYIGFILAGLAIEYSPEGLRTSQSWFVPILVLGVPIFDAVLVVYSRLRRGRSVFRAGHDHTYHRLVRLGLDSQRAVLAMHITALLLGCIAFGTLLLPPLAGNAVFVAVLLAVFAGVIFLDKERR